MATDNTSASEQQTRGWDYATAGDYHRNLDPNWSYTPTYLRKMDVIREFLRQLPKGAAILDAGCGEGVIVEEMRGAGLNMCGIDLNYESPFVTLGSVMQLPYPNETFDTVTMLDVFEHLEFKDQPKALQEVRRVLKPEGQFVASIPNLAHWNSRHSFFFRGLLDRTDIEINHVGERPMRENLMIFANAGFAVTRNVGITLTVPWLYRNLICRGTAKWRWLHDALEPIARLAPSLAMLNVIFYRKAPTD